MASVHLTMPDELLDAIDEYCHQAGMARNEFLRRGAVFLLKTVPVPIIGELHAKMNWRAIERRIQALKLKEQGE